MSRLQFARSGSPAARSPVRSTALPAFVLPLVCLTAIGCGRENTFAPPPLPTVTVATPLERNVTPYFNTTGNTRAAEAVDLRARVGGYLEEIHFRDGALVEKGALLFTLDRRPFNAALDQANAKLSSAEAAVTEAQAAVAQANARKTVTTAALVLADRQFKRTRQLREREANTEADLDTAEAARQGAAAEVLAAEAEVAAAQAAVSTAEANVKAAQSDVATAELNLEYTEVKAPIDGRIGRRQVDVGNLVQPEQTLLARIEAVDPIHVYFTLSESDLLQFLEMNRQGTITISDADPLTIQAALGESGDFAFEGKLDFREFGVDPSTGTTVRRAQFDNDDQRLIPGLFVRIRAAVGDPRPRLLVEERAISADQRGDYLLVVDDEDTVQYRSVTLGPTDGGLRIVESGLEPDDRVVVNGLQRARPGAKVEPEADVMTANPAAAKGAFKIAGAPAEDAPPADGPPADDEPAGAQPETDQAEPEPAPAERPEADAPDEPLAAEDSDAAPTAAATAEG
ncbi:efflux RND transporter periplasmic adaptor subunit [Alienimonas californiensis]|uniref:Efflux pump periplasmic linker BepF n=1 Tax=Alienimonas californiensis TaxID=2527989 RepID=A0A517P532_9PLAN|nr:efflux RND transporter periplasmic adaptor subunit [Alienimonas californiensis]QDT14471.1 Efflux pump periplasmic linker BepF [Alienimonas californiensis]